jgi:hypothetical protein
LTVQVFMLASFFEVDVCSLARKGEQTQPGGKRRTALGCGSIFDQVSFISQNALVIESAASRTNRTGVWSKPPQVSRNEPAVKLGQCQSFA